MCYQTGHRRTQAHSEKQNEQLAHTLERDEENSHPRAHAVSPSSSSSSIGGVLSARTGQGGSHFFRAVPGADASSGAVPGALFGASGSSTAASPMEAESSGVGSSKLNGVSDW